MTKFQELEAAFSRMKKTVTQVNYDFGALEDAFKRIDKKKMEEVAPTSKFKYFVYNDYTPFKQNGVDYYLKIDPTNKSAYSSWWVYADRTEPRPEEGSYMMNFTHVWTEVTLEEAEALLHPKMDKRATQSHPIVRYLRNTGKHSNMGGYAVEFTIDYDRGVVRAYIARCSDDENFSRYVAKDAIAGKKVAQEFMEFTHIPTLSLMDNLIMTHNASDFNRVTVFSKQSVERMTKRLHRDFIAGRFE